MEIKPNHEPFENNVAVPGEGRWPLPHTIENNIRYPLSATERPTEDEELRFLHERKMQILDGLYQDSHDKRQLPGKVFRRSEGSGDFFVASWAGRNLHDDPREVYFYDGRFWYKDELSPEVLDTHTEFLLDAHNTEMRVQALVHSTVRTPDHLADIECLPGTYPCRYLAEEKADASHKYSEPSHSMVEEVLVADSLDAALSEFIEDWRSPFRRYFPARVVIYDGEKWCHIPVEDYGLGPWG